MMSIAVMNDKSLENKEDVSSYEVNVSILSRVALGETDAVEACLDRYGGLVWTLAQRMTASSADAEDATQDIFLELWQKAGSYDPEKSSEATFITMIARRRLIDRIRQSNRVPDTMNIDTSTLEIEVESVSSTPETSDEYDKAMSCIRKLSKEQQQVITLSIHQGISHAGISKQLSMPLGTVKSFARRALIALRDCMKRPRLPQPSGGA